MQATDEPPSWRGYLDAVEPNRIRGWAQNLQQLDAVVLRVFDNGIPIRDVRCDEYRSDLKAAGMGEGRLGSR